MDVFYAPQEKWRNPFGRGQDYTLGAG